VPIRADLSADKERGPGHGRLRVSGFDPKGEAVELSLMRNQGTTPYLGNGGVWQATEEWHPAVDVERAGTELVIRVGPEIVDPIVTQPTTVAYRLTVAAGVARDVGTLTVTRPLLGSGAAHEDGGSDLAAEEAARAAAAAAAEEAERKKVVVPEPPPPIAVYPPEPVPVRPKKWPIVVVLALLALLSGVGGAWYSCIFPGMGAARCSGLEPKPEPETPATTVPEAKPETPAVATTSCAGLDAAACLAKGDAALGAGELEPARQLFQEAAGLGSVEANLRMARMYDPETWSAKTSPVAEADWETAVYWYEAAAKQNDVAGKAGAGRLLCQNAGTGFERKRALEYLKAAAVGGDEKAKAMIAECEAKVS